MNIYCIGNAGVEGDDMPSRLVQFLKKEFPVADIQEVDPTETFTPEQRSILIDTVVGIDRVCEYSDVDVFVTTKSTSVHDYDLGLHLQLLKKIHMLPHIRIIGIPQHAVIEQILPDVIAAISAEQTTV